MTSDIQSLDELIDALRRLPSVGVKTASRMAYHLLQNDREGAQLLADALSKACETLQHCDRCHTLTQQTICSTCQDEKRDSSKLCVVEMPADQIALERTATYQGLYFVLLGRISPFDNVQLQQIGIPELLNRVADEKVKEVILATSFTAEGEITAHIIGEALKSRGLRVTRLARGVPIGSELEYVDLGTIAHALADRR